MNAKDKNFHQDEAASHVALAKHFSKLSDGHNAAADSMDESNPTGAAAMRECAATCSDISNEHVNSAQRHVNACAKAEPDEIEKADDGDEQTGDIKELLTGVRQLLKTVIPDRVSAVPRTNNPMFIRQGQRSEKEIREAQAAAEKVQPELAGVLFDKKRKRLAKTVCRAYPKRKILLLLRDRTSAKWRRVKPRNFTRPPTFW